MEDSLTAKVLFKHLSHFKDNPSLSDVTVVVENSEFRCHRLLLAAASEFFAAAFRSDMKEARQGKITVRNIGAETFSTLLLCIYNGKYILTSKNLFEIWASADMLQMSFLITQCEKLFHQLLSKRNCFDFVCEVRHISLSAKQSALKCIVDNFSQLDICHKISKLDVEELKFVVSNQKLMVNFEDEVLEAVFEWNYWQLNSLLDDDASPDCGIAEDKKEDRLSLQEQNLIEILECTKYLLIKQNCHNCILTSSETLGEVGINLQDIPRKISDYLSQPHLHQTWCPPAALHRDSSQMLNALVICKAPRNGKIKVLNPQNMEWGELLIPTYILTNIAIEHMVYHNSKLFVFREDKVLYTHFCGVSKWCAVPLSESGIFCDIHDSLYVCHLQRKESNEYAIRKFDNFYNVFDKDSVQSRLWGTVSVKEESAQITNFTSTGNILLLFYRIKRNNCYVIQSLSQSPALFKSYFSQLGSCSRLVTLRHNNEVYALQENGCLWKIKSSSVDSLLLKVTRELVLWNGEISLNGAVLYNNQLMIVGDFKNQIEATETLHVSLDGVFESVTKVRRLETGGGYADPPGVILGVIPKSFINYSKNSNCAAKS